MISVVHMIAWCHGQVIVQKVESSLSACTHEIKESLHIIYSFQLALLTGCFKKGSEEPSDYRSLNNRLDIDFG